MTAAVPDPDPGPDPAAVARRLLAARDAGRPLDTPLTDTGELTLPGAYRIQAALTGLRLARGERLVGHKLGYTSLAMRRQMGIDAPNHGPLTDAMLLVPGGCVPGTAMQPRVEPEIGLRIARRLDRPCGPAEVLAACSGAVACLEVVDSVWAGYRFRLEDNTADGSSAGWVMVGAELPLDDLPAIGVTLAVDGEPVASATGAAAGGHPASGVGWLAGQLGDRGLALQPGDLVITGGLTAAYPLAAGGRIEATFSWSGGGATSVAVSR